MQLKLKRFPLLFTANIVRLRYAYGISSRVPRSESHYLLFDCDSIFDSSYFYQRYQAPVISYSAVHGHHAIVLEAHSFAEAAEELLASPYTDHNFVAQGIKRGYWFLETPPFFCGIADLDNFVFMRIERNAQ